MQEELWELLGTGADMDEADEDGVTPLMLAAAHGHTALVAELVAHGANTAARDHHGQFALYAGARRGHLPVVQLLVAHAPHVPVDCALDRGRTPLYGAAVGGHVAVCQWLLACGGARVDAATAQGRTPLLAACLRGHLAVLQLLLAHGADVRHRDHERATALHYAVTGAHVPLLECLWPHFFPPTPPGTWPAAERLLGASLLTLAAARGVPAVVTWLLARGLDPAEPDARSTTPLVAALHYGHVAVAAALQARGGAPPGSAGRGRFVPLLAAIHGGHVAAVDWLAVQCAVCLHCPCLDALRPMDMAIQLHRPHVAAYLLLRGHYRPGLAPPTLWPWLPAPPEAFVGRRHLRELVRLSPLLRTVVLAAARHRRLPAELWVLVLGFLRVADTLVLPPAAALALATSSRLAGAPPAAEVPCDKPDCSRPPAFDDQVADEDDMDYLAL